jgi:hypothetical protein
MICHICHREAVGQCNDCGKFYCQDHGDRYCVKCWDETNRQGKPDAGSRTKYVSDLMGSELPAQSGPLCVSCRQSAVGSCSRCGAFYCSRHGGTHSGRAFCLDCREAVRRGQTMGRLFLLAVMVLALFIMVCNAQSRLRHIHPVGQQQNR